jgi:hypothetical protein
MRNQPKRLVQTSAPVSPVKREIEELVRFKSVFEADGQGIA